MTDITAAFASLLGWQSIALGVMTLVAATACALYLRQRRVSAQYRHAIDHMTQGLCMFDASERIVVYNRRYLEMYKLSPEVVKQGCLLRDLLRHRKEVGLLEADPEALKLLENERAVFSMDKVQELIKKWERGSKEKPAPQKKDDVQPADPDKGELDKADADLIQRFQRLLLTDFIPEDLGHAAQAGAPHA